MPLPSEGVGQQLEGGFCQRLPGFAGGQRGTHGAFESGLGRFFNRRLASTAQRLPAPTP